MQGLLSPMVGRHVMVEQVNSEHLSGRLAEAQSDYLIILDQKGKLVYIQFDHIVSVVINHAELVLPLDGIEINSQPTFAEQLRSLSGQMIRVGVGNRTNDGVVYQVNHKEISLILDMKHTIYYPIHQIQRFTLVQNPDKSSNLNVRSEEKAIRNVLEVSSIHKDKTEESTVETWAKQEASISESSIDRGEVAETDSNMHSRLDGKENTSTSSKLTVFPANENEDLEKDLDEEDTILDLPVPAGFRRKVFVQKHQNRNRCKENAGIPKLTLFYSLNKHFDKSDPVARRKYS